MSTATASKHHPSTFERQSVFARPLVGVDGSDEVIEAARQAAILADGPLVLLGVYDVASWIIGATGTCVPADFDRHQQIRATEALDRARQALGVAAWSRRPCMKPVRGLVGASGTVDLVVVGSRGLHGLKALGSVSERVAHQALSSVLVVREAPWQRAEGQGGNGK